MPVGKLHKLAVNFVKASAQSKAMHTLLDNLQEEEVLIYKRGRNTNGSHVPKNTNSIDYRRATGLETMFGYLYLQGKSTRILELFNIIWDAANI